MIVDFFFAQQGYSGKDFKCDFEDGGMCGWEDKSLNAAVYSWERRQRGETLPVSGPSSDYTIGTATGTVDMSRLLFSSVFGIGKEIQNDRDQRSLDRLVKSNHRNNSRTGLYIYRENKSISTRLKGRWPKGLE